MKGRKIALLLIFLIIVAAGGYFVYEYRKEEVKVYDTVIAQKGDVNMKVSGSGKIEVKDKVPVFAEADQTVKLVIAKEGESIKKGDVLIEYDLEKDRADLEREIREAELKLQNARLNLKSIVQPAEGNELIQYESEVLSAEKNIEDVKSEIESIVIKISQQEIKVKDLKEILDKNEKLLSGGAIAQREYDDSLNNYNIAAESLKDLENQKALKEKTLLVRQDQFAFSQKKLDNSKDRLLDETNVIKYEMQQNNIALSEIAIEKLKNDRSKLKEKEIAPADGIISSVDVKEGAAVHNNTVIAYISDTSGVIGKLDVSEYDAPLIELNQRAELSTSGIPDKTYQGKVSFIWEAAIEKESSDDEIIVPIEIQIENIDDKLKIGYSVDIDIFVKEAVNVLMVPIQAVMQEEEGYFVYQLEDNIPVKKEVQVGLYGDKYVEIISGISEGAEIILRPSEVE